MTVPRETLEFETAVVRTYRASTLTREFRFAHSTEDYRRFYESDEARFRAAASKIAALPAGGAEADSLGKRDRLVAALNTLADRSGQFARGIDGAFARIRERSREHGFILIGTDEVDAELATERDQLNRARDDATKILQTFRVPVNFAPDYIGM